MQRVSSKDYVIETHKRNDIMPKNLKGRNKNQNYLFQCFDSHLENKVVWLS
jgi:hypothetical protein